MSNIKYIIIGIVIAIILFLSGILLGKYKFSTHTVSDPIIKEKIVYETKWKTKIVYKDNKPEFTQENFDYLLFCYEEPFQFKEKIENNYLYVTAFTPCKEATAQYEIGTKGNWKVYFAFAGIGAAAGGAALWYFTR